MILITFKLTSTPKIDQSLFIVLLLILKVMLFTNGMLIQPLVMLLKLREMKWNQLL